MFYRTTGNGEHSNRPRKNEEGSIDYDEKA